MFLIISLALLFQLQIKPGIRVAVYGCAGHVMQCGLQGDYEAVFVAKLSPSSSREDMMYGYNAAPGDITVLQIIRQYAS